MLPPLKKAQKLLTSSSNSQWAGFCFLLSLERMGLSSPNWVAQAQAFATDAKAGMGGFLSLDWGEKGEHNPTTTTTFRSPQYGHCLAVNNMAMLPV